MIFKTFNNDIDKISAKWGIFGKSFNDFVEASRNRKIAIDDLFTIEGVPLKDAKKQTGSFWSYLYPSKESIQSQMIDIDTLYPEMDDSGAQKILDKLKGYTGEWSDYFKTLQEGEKWQIDFVQNTDLQKASLDNVKKGYENARQSAIAHNNALKQQTLGAKALQLTMSALTTVLNMALTYAISKLITAWDDYKEKLREAAAETAEQAKKAKENADSLLDLQKQLDDDTVSADDLTSAFREQMRAMGYTETQIDNLINKYNGLAGAINEATREALENARTDAYADMSTSGKSLKAEAKGNTNVGTWYSQNQELSKEIREMLDDSTAILDGGIYRMDKNASAEDIYSYYLTLKDISQLIQETARETNDDSLLADNTVYSQVSDALDALSESAELYGDAINRLHSADAQIELSNYLKTNDIDTKDAFDDYVEGIKNSTTYSEAYKQVLLQVANDAFPQFSSAAKTASDTISDFPDETADLWGYSETITQLDIIKEKFDTLDKTYSKLFDSDKQIGFEDLSSINEAFSDLSGIETYIQRLQEAGQNQEEVTAVMEDLISAYLDYTGLLDNVTEENATLIEQTLLELGVLNSKELVLARLSGELVTMANAEQLASSHGLDLTEITWEEINALVAEGSISEQVGQQLAYFAIQKQTTNDTVISTEGDCQNLINLAKTAGYSESVLTRLEALKNRLSSNAIMADSMRTNISNAIKNVFAEAELDAESINFKLPEVKYNGGSSTKSAMSSAANSIKEEFEELFDFFEQRVKVLNNAISLLETNLENVSGSFAKNTLLNQGIALNAEKINNYTDALAMYTQKANESLSKLPSDIAEKIQNGAVDLTTFIGDGNEEVIEAIKDYQSWADKISDCNQQLAELKETIRQLELEKFNNIVEDFNNIFDIRDHSKSLIEKQIALLEEAGQLIGDSFYTTQIEQSQKQLTLLEQEKIKLTQQLTSALSSGNIQQGTDEWLEMVNVLTDVESSILDVKTEIEELDNVLLDLHTEVFERIQEQFSNMSSELENLQGLFDDFDVADDKGVWTNEGLSQIGLLAQQYELAKYRVDQYNTEIEELNANYLAGRYSVTEYTDKLAELSEAQWEAVNSSESILDSIVSLNEARVNIQIEGINKEVEAYKELIDTQIEALEAEKDLHDYKKSIEEKTKDVTSLEKQIAALQYDTTASAKAKKALLEEQLAEAKSDLEEIQYNHSIETQKDALNKLYEDYEEEKNAEIEALEESLANREELIANSFESVKSNADLVGQEIAFIAKQHGVTVSNSIIDSWKSGENAIAGYGNTLSAQTSSFIGHLMNVENEVYTLQNQADVTATSLAAMFSTRADNLVNELTNSWYSTYNLNQMSNALQQSLVNALERGYDVSGIISALSTIESAAQSAKSAIDAINSASINVSTNASTPEYIVVDDATSNQINRAGKFSSSSEAQDWIDKYGDEGYMRVRHINGYAGGTRNSKGELIITDEKGYELKLPKLSSGNYTIANEGSQILTKAQTDNIFDWAKISPNIFTSGINLAAKLPTLSKSNLGNTLKIDNLVTINGNIDDTNIKRMETVAQNAVTKAFRQFADEIKY